MSHVLARVHNRNSGGLTRPPLEEYVRLGNLFSQFYVEGGTILCPYKEQLFFVFTGREGTPGTNFPDETSGPHPFRGFQRHREASDYDASKLYGIPRLWRFSSYKNLQL